jgi:hypothetical protein
MKMLVIELKPTDLSGVKFLVSCVLCDPKVPLKLKGKFYMTAI